MFYRIPYLDFYKITAAGCSAALGYHGTCASTTHPHVGRGESSSITVSDVFPKACYSPALQLRTITRKNLLARMSMSDFELWLWISWLVGGVDSTQLFWMGFMRVVE